MYLHLLRLKSITSKGMIHPHRLLQYLLPEKSAVLTALAGFSGAGGDGVWKNKTSNRYTRKSNSLEKALRLTEGFCVR